jgi:dTDP-4-dehydrorhamnose 3,5-epimerase
MKIKKTKINDLFLIQLKKFKDNRGVFFRNFCEKNLQLITKRKIVQSNISINKKKFTLRGFHYQKNPSKEGKFITCVTGKIFNVTMDLRKKSKTYLKLVKMNFTSKKNNMIYIPPGCANAFLTLEENTIIHYLMTDYYKPETYVRFNYKSKEVKVKWPAKPIVISLKDKNAKTLF